MKDGLPEGFTLDEPVETNSEGLPPGFTLDEPKPKQGMGILSLPNDVAELGARGINAAATVFGAEPRKPEPFSFQQADAKNPEYSGIIPAVKGTFESAKTAATLPGDVYAGKVDPLSEEGIDRATQFGMLAIPAAKSVAAGTTKAIARETVPQPNMLSRMTGGRAAAPPENVAAQQFERAAVRDQTTPERIMSDLAQAKAERPEATIADVGGPNVRGLVEGIAQRPGEGNTTITNRLTGTQQAQRARISTDLAQLTGTTRTAVQAVDETMAARRAAADPLYRQAYLDGDREIWSPELERLTSSPTVRHAMQGAVRTWQDNVIADGYGAVNPGAIVDRGGLISFPGGSVPAYPNIQFWDYTKRIIDNQIAAAARAGQNGKVRTLTRLNTQLRTALDAQAPSYRTAREAWSGPSEYMNAIEEGRNILGTGSAEELAAQWPQMTPAQQEAYRIGAVSAIRGKMGRDAAKFVSVDKYLRSPEMRAKVSTIMPTPEAAASWEQRLNHEVRSSELSHQALGNSATIRRQLQQQDAENMVGDLATSMLSHGMTMGLLRRSIMTVPSHIRDAFRGRSDALLADMLTSPQSMTALQEMRARLANPNAPLRMRVNPTEGGYKHGGSMPSRTTKGGNLK